MIQGAFDTATVQAREGGYPPPKYEAFKKRYLKRNMKADGGRIGYDEGSKLTDFVDVQASGSITGKNQVEGAPEGITANNQLINAIIRLDIPLSEKTNFLADYSYGKGRTKYEEGDKELFLDEGGYTDRNVGFGYNQDGEGFGGSVMRNLRTGDDNVQLRYKKNIDFNRLFKADGGMLVQPSDDGSRPGYRGSGDREYLLQLVEEANKGFKLVKRKDLQVKAGYSKSTNITAKDIGLDTLEIKFTKSI